MTSILKKPRIFIMTSRLYATAGGRTRATIDRMAFLQKYFDVTLIEMSATKYPGREIPEVFAKYQLNFQVINPWHVSEHASHHTRNYLKLLKERTGRLGDEEVFEGVQKAFSLPTLSGGKIKSYLDDGQIKRLREYHPDGRVEVFILNDKQNIFLRELHNSKGQINRYYLDDAGTAMAGFYSAEDGTKQYMYRTNDGKAAYSRDIAAHHLVFLNDLLCDGDTLISDVRYYDEVIGKLDTGIKKIHVWHEIATSGPDDGLINPEYEMIAGPNFALSDQDKIVVFTSDARDEYEQRFPHLKGKIVTIPYGTDIKPDMHGIYRDENSIISIGRLKDAQKNVSDQIRAFAIFHRAYPETHLNIFGDGDDRDKLRLLVHDLGLDEAVTFHGFADNPDEKFQGASMMIFSSNNETFGLTILESLSNGTPVVSYDVRFGARTMIQDYQNGLIAKESTPEALADAMAQIYAAKLHPEQVKNSIRMSFSREMFETKWVGLISDSARVL